MLEVQVIGDKALARKLKDFEPKVVKKAIKKGSRAGNKLVLKKARQSAPKLKRSTRNRTAGELRRSIKVQTLKDKKGSYGTRVNIVFKGDRKSNWYYGAWVNYGWKPKARRKDGTYVNGKVVKGTNFMENARTQEGKQALNTALGIIKDEINQGW